MLLGISLNPKSNGCSRLRVWGVRLAIRACSLARAFLWVLGLGSLGVEGLGFRI